MVWLMHYPGKQLMTPLVLPFLFAPPQWISEIQAGYQLDTQAQDMMSKLAIHESSVPNFTLSAGILRYKSRIWVGDNPVLQDKLLHACHASALGGHSGFPVTYMRMKRMFAWKGMKQAVALFVKNCITCQRAKPDRSKLPGLLQPLEVPSGAWQTISLDFVEGLPLSSNANCNLVAVDSFTKYAHFVPLRHPFIDAGVARTFMQQAYRLHGLPSAIVSDRDRIFTSNFWSELFKLAGVGLRMSSSYHPSLTVKLNVSIRPWRLSCAALSMLVQTSGSTGCP